MFSGQRFAILAMFFPDVAEILLKLCFWKICLSGNCERIWVGWLILNYTGITTTARYQGLGAPQIAQFLHIMCTDWRDLGAPPIRHFRHELLGRGLAQPRQAKPPLQFGWTGKTTALAQRKTTDEKSCCRDPGLVDREDNSFESEEDKWGRVLLSSSLVDREDDSFSSEEGNLGVLAKAFVFPS